MPRVVDVTTVHATTYSLADEATLALQVQRTCWPTAAYRLHFSFFHTHLSGNLLHRSSYPCTLLLDVIRLVRVEEQNTRSCTRPLHPRTPWA